MKRPVLWMTLLLLCLSSACGAAVEVSQVQTRFQTVFGCPAERVVDVAGGYRVEGCGIVAHYRCIEEDSDRDSDEHGLVGALVDAATDTDPCVMEHSERTKQAAPVLAERDGKDGALMFKAELGLEGGQLTAYGKPSMHPEQALLVLYSKEPFAAGSCKTELFRDGVAVPIAQSARMNDHKVRVLVRLESLRDVQHALRFAGNLCGREFELDEERRKQLGLFHIRVSEELARLRGPSSGGELSASAR